MLNNDVFGDGCISVSNKCIVGYNVKKYRNIYVNIVEKYVKYFSDSIENHFADNKKVKLYLREHCSALCSSYNLWFKNQDIVFTFPKARCVSFDTEEDREQWKNLYNRKYWFKRLLSIINSSMFIAYNRLQYFKPGTTLEEVKQHFHLTDEEVKALEDYHV